MFSVETEGCSSGREGKGVTHFPGGEPEPQVEPPGTPLALSPALWLHVGRRQRIHLNTGESGLGGAQDGASLP